MVPRRLDTEDAQLALERIQELLKKHALVENLVRRQEEGDEQADIIEGLLRRQHEAELEHTLNQLHPADIAFILESLPSEQRRLIWSLVNAKYDGDILLEVDDWVREDLISSMNREDLLAATEDLDADELADLAPDLPADIVAEVQKGLTNEERAQLLEAMGYPEDTVGAIMDFEMVRVREDVSLEVVLRYLRRLEELPDHTDQIFVVDRQDRLQGVLSISQLLVNDPDTNVKDVMKTDYLSLKPSDDDTDAASAFERYDLVSAPVVNRQNRLIGRVTIADMVDVIREDSQEQDLSRAGLHEEDIFAPVVKAIKNRSPWLLINLCTASTAAVIASQFEGTVSHIVILAFLMSIVAGIGGNSGNQTMTMVIRALAVGRITSKNFTSLLKREFIVTILVGFIGTIVAAGFSWAISGSFKIALVMATAMLCNMLIGAMLGVLIPIFRDKFGKDPAIGSSVLLTFVTDSLGFFIFLGLASIFLL
ncbi:magnesium transporter [Advenella alkanexedens]|uniref:Magnesium transporter MgtE n=2 Tax=Advenella alkanexedens TaxID=1481665 RepID=A0ABS6NQD5_9BURK|nr:magnesium transporter [Advenella alkanexedens]MBV4397853.1 magnesium transporter [Advenella alkanexedens]